MKKTKITIPNINDDVQQGDIFADVEYIYKIDEYDDYIDVTRLTFPYAIVISQSCDVRAMSEIVTNKRVNGVDGCVKTVGFMPSVILVPIYNESLLKDGRFMDDVISQLYQHITVENSYGSKDKGTIEKDMHYRFYSLKIDNNQILAPSTMDFRQYFSVNMEYLINNRANRICRVASEYCHDITQKFANYVSRTAFED